MSRVLARLVALLPWRSLRALGTALGFFVGSVLRIRREHVETSMAQAGIGEPARWARRLYASLGTALVEFLWMAGRPGSLAAKVELSSRAEEALARHAPGAGRGVIVATAHTGNWDLVGCAAAAELLPGLCIATKRLHVAWLDRFWQTTRRARGAELLDGEGLFARLSERIGAGHAVALLIDQAPDRNSAVAELPFLGRPARTDLMPAMLAARTGAPILMALGRRRADGAHVIDIPRVLLPPPRPSRAWIDWATEQLNGELEAFVRAYPDQWMWLHRRWKPFAGRPKPSTPGVVPSLVSQPAGR